MIDSLENLCIRNPVNTMLTITTEIKLIPKVCIHLSKVTKSTYLNPKLARSLKRLATEGVGGNLDCLPFLLA